MLRPRHIRPLSCLFAGCLVACGGARGPLYEGERRPASEVARIVEGKGRANISVQAIDAREVSGGSWEVLPGNHAIEAKVKIFKSFDDGGAQTKAWFRMTCYGTFAAEAGREYVVSGEVGEQGYGVLSVTLTLGMRIADAEHPDVQLGDVTCYF